MVWMDEVITDDLWDYLWNKEEVKKDEEKVIKDDEEPEKAENATFKGIYRARTVGTSTILTAPVAEVGQKYALFVSAGNVLVFVPLNRLSS